MIERMERTMKNTGPRLLAIVAVTMLLAACDASKDPSSKDASAGDGGTEIVAAGSGDWSQWGHSTSKNMTAPAKNLPSTFEPGEIVPDVWTRSTNLS